MMSAEVIILEGAVRALAFALDNLVDACLEGKVIKAPPRKAIMNARARLPKWCKHTLEVTK